MPETNDKKIASSDGKDYSEISKSKIEALLRYRRVIVFLVHIFAFAISLALSFLLIKNMQLQMEWIAYQYPIMLLLMLPIKLVVFGFFKQYAGWWRYVGISDLLIVAKAALVSTAIIVVAWYCGWQIDYIRPGIEKLEGLGDG